MGKTQYKKRIRTARQDAVGTPLFSPADIASKRGDRSSTGKEREDSIVVLEKINSPSVHDRLWSLAAASNFVLSSPSTRRLLLSKNLITLLIARLLDRNEEQDCVIEATGCLRNLAIEGGAEVCGEMWNKGVGGPLGQVLQRVQTTLDAEREGQSAGAGTRAGAEVKKAAALAQQRAKLWLLGENIATVFWCLAETSDKILSGLSGIPPLVPFLVRILGLASNAISAPASPSKGRAGLRTGPHTNLVVAAGQCLLALTEDDVDVVHSLLQPSEATLIPLVALLGAPSAPSASAADAEDWQLVSVIVAGILCNVLTQLGDDQKQALSFREEVEEKIPRVLGEMLKNADLNAWAAESASAFANLPEEPLGDIKIAKASVSAPSAAEITLESVSKRLTTAQVSLEVLGDWATTACSLGDAEEEWGGIADDEADGASEASRGSEDVTMEDEGERNEAESDDIGMMEEVFENVSASSDGQLLSGTISPSTLDRFASFIPLLSALAVPTPISLQPANSAPVHTLPTSADGPAAAIDVGRTSSIVAELLATVHIRAAQALSNLLVALARLNPADAPTASSPIEAWCQTQTESLQNAWRSLFSATASLVPLLGAPASADKKGKGRVGAAGRARPEQELLLACLGGICTLLRVLGSRLIAGTPEVRCLEAIINAVGASGGGGGGIESDLVERVLEALGALGSRPGVSLAENEAIGSLLVACATNNQSAPAVAVAALDGLFDLYADENGPWDMPVFRAKGFLDRLVAAQPGVKALVKRVDKRKAPALRTRAEAASANLAAFIQYRRSVA